MKKYLLFFFVAIAFVACNNEDSSIQPDAARASYEIQLSANTFNTFDVYYVHLDNEGNEATLSGGRLDNAHLMVQRSTFPCTFEGRLYIAPKADATCDELSYSVSMEVASVKKGPETGIDGYKIIQQDGYRETFERKGISNLQAFADSFNMESVKHSYLVLANGKIQRIK